MSSDGLVTVTMPEAASSVTTPALKLIYRADEMRLIGAHMIGEQSIELINVGLLLIQMNATLQPFIEVCFNFPRLAELYEYATYDAMKREQQGRVQGSPTIKFTNLALYPAARVRSHVASLRADPRRRRARLMLAVTAGEDGGVEQGADENWRRQ